MLVGLIAAGVALAVAVWGFVTLERRAGPAGLRERRRTARLALMPVPGTPIAAVKDGERVRLTGRAAPLGPLLTSPISRRRCIGFRLTADTGGAGVWERVFQLQALDSFVLSDGTGEAVLHPPFQIELDPYDAGSDNVPPALVDLLKRDGVRLPTGGSEVLRYFETILVPGDEIIAVGRVTMEIDPAGRAPGPRKPPVTCHLNADADPVVLAEANDAS